MLIDIIIDKILKAKEIGTPQTIFISKSQERLLFTDEKDKLDGRTTMYSNGCIETINGVKLVVVEEEEGWEVQVSIKL